MKKRETYSFTGAAGKGERSTGRVSQGAAIVYNSRMEYVGGDDVLEVLDKLYASISVLQFGNKY